MEDAPSSAVEGYEEAIERMGSILGDSEPSAARRELGEHARRFAEEAEVLLGRQLAVIEQEEARAVRLVASLQERARTLAEREQVVSEQQERLRVGEAELDERIGREQSLEADRAAKSERLEERARTLTEREQSLSEQQERLRLSEAELDERGRRLDELRSERSSLDERIAHEE
jgi:chromosome segregation ATPase